MIKQLLKLQTWKAIAAVCLTIHAAVLVTWVTIRVFGDDPPDIPPGTATALAAVYGLPALSYGVATMRKHFRGARRSY